MRPNPDRHRAHHPPMCALSEQQSKTRTGRRDGENDIYMHLMQLKIKGERKTVSVLSFETRGTIQKTSIHIHMWTAYKSQSQKGAPVRIVIIINKPCLRPIRRHNKNKTETICNVFHFGEPRETLTSFFFFIFPATRAKQITDAHPLLIVKGNSAFIADNVCPCLCKRVFTSPDYVVH